MGPWTGRCSRGIATAFLAAVLAPFLAAPAVAEGSGSPTAPPRSTGFYRGHFLPRLERQLQSQFPLHVDAIGGRNVEDDMLYARLQDSSRRDLERATQGALEDFLLEETSLSGVVDSLVGAGRRAGVVSQGAGGRDKGFHFDLRVSHSLPAVDVRRVLGSGQLRMRLNAFGDLGLSFAPRARTPAYFGLGFNAERAEFQLDCHFGF